MFTDPGCQVFTHVTRELPMPRANIVCVFAIITNHIIKYITYRLNMDRRMLLSNYPDFQSLIIDLYCFLSIKTHGKM